tara:strand:+ start:159 stop:584 length:426 start_codon:yes stop_codon:yes gene_type:complete
MSKNLKLLMDALQNEGMRYTKQRKLVWDEICRNKEHRDAEEIYLKINKTGRNVSRATVYRTIDVLVKNNLVRQLELGDGRKRFENKLDSTHHDHIVCLSCGDIQEFVDDLIESQQDKIAKEYNFKIVRHIHQLFGLCKNCK